MTANMKSLIGIAVFTLGALPLVAGGVMGADHMYAVGLSRVTERALAALLIAEIVCLSVGLYLIATRSRSRKPFATYRTAAELTDRHSDYIGVTAV